MPADPIEAHRTWNGLPMCAHCGVTHQTTAELDEGAYCLQCLQIAVEAIEQVNREASHAS